MFKYFLKNTNIYIIFLSSYNVNEYTFSLFLPAFITLKIYQKEGLLEV